jgi:hypothetical protein
MTRKFDRLRSGSGIKLELSGEGFFPSFFTKRCATMKGRLRCALSRGACDQTNRNARQKSRKVEKMTIENGPIEPAQDGPVVPAGPPIGDEKTVPDKSKTEPRQVKSLANGRNAAPDPFNVDDLVVSQDYVQCCGPKQQLTIPKNKPGPKVFIRICPDPEYQKSFNILEFKDDGEIYIVKKSMAHILSGETYLATLYVGITKQGTMFVWPVRCQTKKASS